MPDRTKSRPTHKESSVALNFSLKDLYRGLLRNSSTSREKNHHLFSGGLYFGGFDTVKEVLCSEDKELTLWKRWVLAQGATTFAGLASYPLDTVRRRIMMQSGIENPMYSSTVDCWKKIYRSEGLASFYHGALSNMCRSIGSAAILFCMMK
uniref:ADP/ATP translocase n=1 Tax=Brassica oleracea TaxID=3712 RepID=A0A3P6D5B4_BRAOL|nr:unnamed protein product [Brassica oleracea]